MRLALAAIALAASIHGAAAQATLQGRGEALLQKNCAYCHAIGRTGDSPHRGAPAFRHLMQRYAPESLEEALAEGLVTGHADMPEFVFEPADIAAIVAHFRSLRRR
jgi:mono/diheme cytochrome c family protein